MNEIVQPTEIMDKFVEMPVQHPGQANLVKIGLWNGRRVAMKTARRQDGSLNEFYVGISSLFNASLQVPYHYLNMYRILSVHSTLPVPHLYSTFPLEATRYQPTHAYVEGRAAVSFAELTQVGAELYGKHLARLHSVKVSGAGCTGALVTPTQFHKRLCRTIDLLSRIAAIDDETRRIAHDVLLTRDTWPMATYFAPIMLDLDPTQYFAEDGRLTHLIDIDFVVFGPPELELVALESIFPHHLSDDFIRGYRSVRDFPVLAPVRQPYRLLNRLLCVQGRQPAHMWNERETLFP
ncbi:hypothetical protein NZD89_27500 [Alicyclobacillus fastidiosus]|uniref:Aminoglycoside phosphotransferase domain-containing protein n=1 Tax=Alicyclobacillus fastidiosus TaxID=392011 RepID=A0ABY6ZI57_9BACL|nr:hypothetical protein [Alicyclobacillus fastidiosus]WAH41901.1 hypothetical protein NZD89_27500 [Alicyclobacillus fastidiosus]GMA63613.1 hypothetical protein GCM10025859_40530 [Alicyclobacillus fastidiosus]